MLLMLAATPAPPTPVARSIIASKLKVDTQKGTVDTSAGASRTDRTRHVIRAAARDLQVSFGNVAGHEPSATPITVAAALEVGGTVHPLTFSGAARVSIPGGGSATTDPLPVSVAVGDVVYARTYITVAAGHELPVTEWVGLVGADGEGTTGDSGADLTVGGAAPPTAPSWGIFGIRPLAISGTPTAPTGPVFGIFGDSIASGVGDGADKGPNGGFLDRAMLAKGYPWVNFARGGGLTEHMLYPTWRAARLGPCLPWITHAITEYGTNDIQYGLGDLPLVKQRAVTWWTWLVTNRPGLVLWQTTTTPAGTGGAPSREPWNAWLRDGAPISGTTPAPVGGTGIRAGEAGHPLRGVIDVTTVVDDGAGSWLPGMNSDGLHPSSAGHIAMSEVVAAAI